MILVDQIQSGIDRGGFRQNFSGKLNAMLMHMEPATSSKLGECINAVKFRLKSRKNFRNSIALLARLGGNALSTGISKEAVEQFVLHALLLGPLSFIDLVSQDPPCAALKAGEKFSENYITDVSPLDWYKSGGKAIQIAEDLLMKIKQDKVLSTATSGWSIMPLLKLMKKPEHSETSKEFSGNSCDQTESVRNTVLAVATQLVHGPFEGVINIKAAF